MNETHERSRTASAGDDVTVDPGGSEESNVPYVVVENGDDADLTVSVSVRVVGENAPPIGARYRIAGDRKRAVSLRGSSGDPPGDVCRIEIDAGIGASAQVSLDPSRLDEIEAPVPRFVVRNGRITVSGLTTASEREVESKPEPGLS